MKKTIINFIKLIARYILIALNGGFICMGTKKNRIIFESFNGRDISDNPLAIYRQLISDRPELRQSCYFSVKPSEYRRLAQAFPTIQLLKRFTPGWVGYIGRADYWVMNSRMPKWWKKNRRTTYIQTWHGTPLKRLGVDIDQVEIPGSSTAKYHRDFVEEAARWDYLIAPNQYSKTIFSRAFQFHNRFLDIGYPRNDILYQQDNLTAINQLKQRLFGMVPKKVVMYAPTWRDDDYRAKGVYNFELPFDLATFFKNVDADTRLIIRPHYLVKDHIDITGFEDRVSIMADADINQLYLVTDLLITDYSSVMFDFANLKRPMLFFPYDLAHYRDELRGFYFNYDQQHLPGPMVTTAADFYQQLAIFNRDGEFSASAAQLAAFNDQFCAWENGLAAEKVSQLILRGNSND